jgi:hypothetical protein
MDLKPGMRLWSLACDTEIIVIRAPATSSADLTCGGELMSTAAPNPASRRSAGAQSAGGSLLGKRYTLGDQDDLEVLVTRAGAGTLAADGAPLTVKAARPLPSSD